MSREDLKARIDVIEEGYEFFLAYAAQGLTDDASSKIGPQLREYLDRYEVALDGLDEAFRAHLPVGDATEAALAVLKRDAEAVAGVRRAGGRPAGRVFAGDRQPERVDPPASAAHGRVRAGGAGGGVAARFLG